MATEHYARVRYLLEHGLREGTLGNGQVHSSAQRIVASTANLLQQAYYPLARWFGGDGTSILISRALDRATTQFPVLSDSILEIVDSGIQFRLMQNGSDHDPLEAEAVYEAMVGLIETLLSLLTRLIGADLVTRLTHEAWPQEISHEDS